MTLSQAASRLRSQDVYAVERQRHFTNLKSEIHLKLLRKISYMRARLIRIIERDLDEIYEEYGK